MKIAAIEEMFTTGKAIMLSIVGGLLSSTAWIQDVNEWLRLISTGMGIIVLLLTGVWYVIKIRKDSKDSEETEDEVKEK